MNGLKRKEVETVSTAKGGGDVGKRKVGKKKFAPLNYPRNLRNPVERAFLPRFRAT